MWFLDFRTRDVGGQVANTPRLLEGESLRGFGLAALPVGEDGVTFVLHGFNNDRDEGVAGIAGFTDAGLEAVERLGRTTVVGVLWPGDAVFQFLSYPTEEKDADATARKFARTLYHRRFPFPVHMIAHSLGTRVVLQALMHLTRWDPDHDWVGEIVLMAAAMDSDGLGRRDRYRRAVNAADRLVNVASTEDRVLRYAFPLGDFFAGLFSGGYTRSALGRSGPGGSPPAPDHVRSFHVGRHGVRHGDYLTGKTPLQKRSARFAARAAVGRQRLRY